MRILLSVACMYFITMIVCPEVHDAVLAFPHKFTMNLMAMVEIIFKEKPRVIDHTSTWATPGQQMWTN
jgi:hypothetical protein